jgi:hypothetical protein
MGEHRNDLARPVIGGHCHRAGPTFQTDPLPNSAFGAFKGREANVGAQAFGLAREVQRPEPADALGHYGFRRLPRCTTRRRTRRSPRSLCGCRALDADVIAALHPEATIKEPLDLSTDELWAERGEIVACPNDKAAIKVAEQWAQEQEVEVWEKSRFIARVQLRKENPA